MLAENVMEVYFKDLISREATVDRLVDNLMRVVQGVEEFAEASGAKLQSDRPEVASKLARLKESCGRVKQHAQNTALAVDKTMRRHPYTSIGVAFTCGLALGFLAMRSRRPGGEA